MISKRTKNIEEFDKEQLLVLLQQTSHELFQKKLSLRETRERLRDARKRIRNLRETVSFQRKRIVDLYRDSK